MKNKALEELVVAFSMANLLFITSWRKLLYPSSESYHVKLEPYSLDYAGILISVSLAALILFGGLRLFRYLNKGENPLISKLIFLVAAIIIINGIRLQFFESDSNIYFKIGFFLTIAVVGVFLFFKWQNQLLKFVKTAFLILSPFILITFSQAIWGFFNANPQAEPPLVEQLAKVQPKGKTEIKNRIVWIIFDEMDYFVPFGKNPPPVELPAFNRLKNESLFATNATSPAYATIESIPALLTGKMVEKSVPDGKNELKLNFKDERVENFGETETVFRKVKQMNGETAVVGWYHPYCRVIGKDLSACHWESYDTANDFQEQTLYHKLIKNFGSSLSAIPILSQGINAFDLRFQSRNAYLNRHENIESLALEIAKHSAVDLALIHLPFPHAPNHFDKRTRNFNKETGFNSLTNYSDNLVLSDLFLERLKATMENNNIWNDTTVIVSSDHQWRVNKWKNSFSFTKEDMEISQGVEHSNIPFFLKLKNQKDSLIYDKPFNTVITSDLILAIMKGEISTKEDAAKWLDTNSTP